MWIAFGVLFPLEGEMRCEGGGVAMCEGCNGGKVLLLSPSPSPFLRGKGRDRSECLSLWEGEREKWAFLWGREGELWSELPPREGER